MSLTNTWGCAVNSRLKERFASERACPMTLSLNVERYSTPRSLRKSRTSSMTSEVRVSRRLKL